MRWNVIQPKKRNDALIHATRADIDSTVPSENRHTQKAACCMIYMNVQNRQIPRGRSYISGCQGLGVGAGGERLLMDAGFL